MKKVWLIALLGGMLISCTNSQTMKQETEQASRQEAVLNTIQTRASVRQFTGEKISNEQIETLLRCAMCAPTAMNRQPWAFIVVTEDSLLQKMGEAFPYSRCGNGAACAFVMCGDMSKALEGEGQAFWINDVSAATENLLLAAHAMGLGGVWTGVYPSSDRTPQVQAMLGLPENVLPMCIVPIGVPAEQPEIKDKFKAENIHYNCW